MPTTITIRLPLILLIIAVVGFSCSNAHHSSTATLFLDTTAFPKRPFLKVALLTLDSLQKTTVYNDGMTQEDTNVVAFVGKAGYSFVDRNGIPKTRHFHTYWLDSSQIKRLEGFLVQQPCTESYVLNKTCAPSFKRVFVFYNQDLQPVASVHVCFKCEVAVFWPEEGYMCDFDNKVNYKAFKAFTDSFQTAQTRIKE